MKTILVTGANGQLGSEMRVLSSAYPAYRFIFVSREELAIDDSAALEQFFAKNAVQFCVNCAAYTAVDKAESDQEKAYSINASAVGNLARLCREHNAVFIHVSTDYVFDGTATSPYKEDDLVSPVNLYGASKLKGEQEAVANNADSIIIRTSWVYSSFGNNFVKTMLRLMSTKEAISVVADQQGCPTYAADLAAAIMQIIEKTGEVPLGTKSAIFNYSNQGVITWHQFATAIKELTGSPCVVNPIPAAQYPTPAKRPAYSVMDTGKIRRVFNLEIPEWKDSLEKCLQILRAG